MLFIMEYPNIYKKFRGSLPEEVDDSAIEKVLIYCSALTEIHNSNMSMLLEPQIKIKYKKVQKPSKIRLSKEIYIFTEGHPNISWTFDKEGCLALDDEIQL